MPHIDPLKPADKQLRILASDRRILERAEKVCDVLVQHGYQKECAEAAAIAISDLRLVMENE